jgi:AAA15 family ATPase/GTPase
MIINFSIQNFGSVKEKQTLSFEATDSTDLESYYIAEPIKGLRLLKLLLIYGANASGKTTILNALEFLRDLVLDPLEKKTDGLKFEPFLFDETTPTTNSVLSIEFVQESVRYLYEVEFNKKCVVEEWLFFFNPNKAKIFNRTTDLENQFVEISFGSKIKRDKPYEKALAANTLWNNTVLGGFLKTNIDLPELKQSSSWFSDHLRPLIQSHTRLEGYVSNSISKTNMDRATVIEILKKADLHISDVLIKEEEQDVPDGLIEYLERQTKVPNESLEKIKSTGKITSVTVEFEHTVGQVKYKLPIDLESQGTRRYFCFAGLMHQFITKSVVIPIDELESSLHPDLFIHYVLSFLVNAKTSQLLATTHNREILDNRDLFRNDAIWFTDKSEQEATKLYSLEDFDSNVIRNTSNVYNAYKIGKLGGVPNLGDYYLETGHENK